MKDSFKMLLMYGLIVGFLALELLSRLASRLNRLQSPDSAGRREPETAIKTSAVAGSASESQIKC